MLPLLALALGALISLFLLSRRDPRLGLTIWLVVIGFVPIWLEATVIVPISAASGVGAVVLLAMLVRTGERWALPDLLVMFLFVVAMAPIVIGRVSVASFFAVSAIWAVGYGLGRMTMTLIDPRWVYGAIAVVFTVVAVLTVVEFFADWHGLASWGPSNATKSAWSSIRVRSGLARSEGAFGNSIALGASMSIALVLTVESRFRPAIRLSMVAVMLLGAALTLSRTAVLCAAVGLLFTILFSRSAGAREVRGGLVALLLLGGAAMVPFFRQVLSASAEAEGSAEYRGELTSLIPFFDVFGRSSSLQITPQGQAYFGPFHSIDSQLILFGLSYGWMTLGLVLLLLLLALGRCLVGRASAPTIAIVGQLPALTTVALITQYHIFFWFTAGLAVGAEVLQLSARTEGVSLMKVSDHLGVTGPAR